MKGSTVANLIIAVTGADEDVQRRAVDALTTAGIEVYRAWIEETPGDRYEREYGAGASAEPVIDRDGIQVYATDAGRYVAADKGGWVEGTYGTPEEAWTAGASGE